MNSESKKEKFGYYFKVEGAAVLISILLIALIACVYYQAMVNKVFVSVDSYVTYVDEQFVRNGPQNMHLYKSDSIEFLKNSKEIYFQSSLSRLEFNDDGYVIVSSEELVSNIPDNVQYYEYLQNKTVTFNRSKELFMEMNGEKYLLTVNYAGNTFRIIWSDSAFLFVTVIVVLLVHLLLISNAYHRKGRINLIRQQECDRLSFMRSAAHELKTPVAVIKANTECLEIIEDEDKRKNYFAAIKNATDSLGNRINLILDYSKLTSDDFVPKKEKCNLAELLKEVYSDYETLADKKNIKTEIQIEDSIIYADRKLMVSVLDNLLSNSVKYADECSVIKIHIDRRIFEIVNDCKNVSDLDINHIWDDHYTNSKEFIKDSFGIGLAICRRIFELQNFKYGCEKSDTALKFWFSWQPN